MSISYFIEVVHSDYERPLYLLRFSKNVYKFAVNYSEPVKFYKSFYFVLKIFNALTDSLVKNHGYHVSIRFFSHTNV